MAAPGVGVGQVQVVDESSADVRTPSGGVHAGGASAAPGGGVGRARRPQGSRRRAGRRRSGPTARRPRGSRRRGYRLAGRRHGRHRREHDPLRGRLRSDRPNPVRSVRSRNPSLAVSELGRRLREPEQRRWGSVSTSWLSTDRVIAAIRSCWRVIRPVSDPSPMSCRARANCTAVVPSNTCAPAVHVAGRCTRVVEVRRQADGHTADGVDHVPQPHEVDEHQPVQPDPGEELDRLPGAARRRLDVLAVVPARPRNASLNCRWSRARASCCRPTSCRTAGRPAGPGGWTPARRGTGRRPRARRSWCPTASPRSRRRWWRSRRCGRRTR